MDACRILGAVLSDSDSPSLSGCLCSCIELCFDDSPLEADSVLRRHRIAAPDFGPIDVSEDVRRLACPVTGLDRLVAIDRALQELPIFNISSSEIELLRK